MDIGALITVFMWCTIINGSLLILWTVFTAFAPDLVYRTQSMWFPIPRETYNVVMYAFLGVYKIVFLVFNLIPYVALQIVR